MRSPSGRTKRHHVRQLRRNHPVVLAHARALLTGPPGTIGHIDADLNDPSALPALFWLTEEHARSPTNCSSLVMNSQISLFMYRM